MRKIIYITMANILISASLLSAQSVKVVYQEKLKMPANVHELNNQAIASAVEAQLSKMNKTMVLYYDKGKSFFEQLSGSSSQNNAQVDFQSNINIKTTQVGSGGSYYKDQKKNESVSQEYIMDKEFLITEPLSSEWKLLSEEKKVVNYLCKKAVNEQGIIAWYCPDIPINDGPYLYQGLPGLILEVETPIKTITMQSIELDAKITNNKILPPKTGRKVSRNEFSKMKEKKNQELGVTGGKGISVIKM